LTRDLLPNSHVASAFQNLSARDLLRPAQELRGDVAVCADEDTARQKTMELARDMKDLRPIDAGALSNSRYVEELTALLVNVNRIYKAHSTVQFLGI
jgi:predicted dinucleotide-binding enzyme